MISATGIDTVLVRRLQDGDAGGHMRRALAAFPIRRAADGFLTKYFLPEGREPGKPYALLPMYKQVVRREREEAQMLGAFAEVWLAKEGHDGLVGANLLTKIQRPNLAALYGSDARRRGLHPDGRRHPARDSAGPRRLRDSTRRRS